MPHDSIVAVDFDYTYNGKLSTDVLFKPTVDTPPISDFMTIRQGFKYKEQIPLLGPLSKHVKRYTNCGRTFTKGVDITNTTIQLTDLELNMEWCKNDFEQTLRVGNNLAEEFLRDGIEEFDPSGTQIQRIIDELVNDTLRRDTFRILMFADDADADADWAQLDGMWTQLIASAGGGGSYCVNQVADFADAELAAGAALTAFRAAYEDSAIILKQLPNSMKYFAVTGSLYENLLTSYESNTTGNETQFLNLVQGQGDQGTNLTYRGIKVMPIYAWDQSLADPTCPLFGRRHLMLYTTRDNHAAGFARQSDSEKISGFFDRTLRKYFVEGFYRMGYSFFHCDLQTIGA